MKSLSILLLFLTAFTGAMAQEETCSENTIVRLTTGMAQGEIQMVYMFIKVFLMPGQTVSCLRNFPTHGKACGISRNTGTYVLKLPCRQRMILFRIRG